jgi:hypothetical protein
MKEIKKNHKSKTLAKIYCHKTLENCQTFAIKYRKQFNRATYWSICLFVEDMRQNGVISDNGSQIGDINKNSKIKSCKSVFFKIDYSLQAPG